MEKDAEGQLGKLLLVIVGVAALGGIEPVLGARPLNLPFFFQITTATLLMTVMYISVDTVAETVSKKWAKRLIYIVIGAMLFSVTISNIVAFLPTVKTFPYEAGFQYIFSEHTKRVPIALTALFISQRLNLELFVRIRNITGPKWLWFRNILSTSIAALIGSGIAAFILFYGTSVSVFAIWMGLYIGRLTLSLLDTPIVYLTVWLWKRY